MCHILLHPSESGEATEYFPENSMVEDECGKLDGEDECDHDKVRLRGMNNFLPLSYRANSKQWHLLFKILAKTHLAHIP